MKIQTTIERARTCLLAVVLMAVGTAITVRAGSGPPTLQGQITLRPLTPGEIKAYGLTGLQGASGLSAVGLGQPAYLDVLVNNAIPASSLTNITWSLTVKPIGSSAVLTNSPLGTNVPTYKMADRISNSGAAAFKVAGRTLLRPDIAGQYTVTATITTATYGTTNLTQKLSGGTYMGVYACEFCHSGSVLAEDKYHPWSQTAHATMFTRGIDGLASDHYSKNCISCHTLGYDTNTNAVNGGFDDIATNLNWTFPAVLTNGNWASMQANYPSLTYLANIQCENCHGPGSEHILALGNTNLSNWPRLGVSFVAGECAQCHDSPTGHIKNAEWNSSLHARPTRTPSGPTRAACARCHTPSGFAAYTATLGTTNAWTGTNVAYTAYEAITCATCHEPHDASNPHQLRTAEVVKLGDGETVATIANAGAGSLCMNCHQSRTGSYTNSLVNYPLSKPTYPGNTPSTSPGASFGTTSFGPHDNPAADMLEGVNGYTYGKVIPSSAHRSAVTDTCVGCHMQTVATNSPAYAAAFTNAGGHTFSMTYKVVAGGATNTMDLVDVCVKCHGPITSFDMVKIDYNSDGVIEGVQTEVQKLLDKLSTMLPPTNYMANSNNYAADGLVKSPSPATNWPPRFLQATWNWQLVNNDISKGIHNAAYSVGLLKASIADLSGDANNDGIADWWQLLHFGANWANDPNATPTATPALDNVPNWLKNQLGLDPWVAGAAIPGGFVWGPSLISSQGTNTVTIYTAAEVVFDTQVGKWYQVQSISSLGGAWQNVGGSIAGTGGSVSYVAPTRQDPQQFFRVVHNP